MGPLEVDLFTSWLTALLPRFYSWRLDPEAEAIDAFTQNWGLNRSYANPPRCFINRYLNQVKQQQARIVLLTRSSTVDCMAHLWRSFSSQGLSTNVSELLLCSWISKTNQSYNSLCSRWMDWCQPRNRNPFEGPVSDVVNFLVELYLQSYQYRSLNSYRSAITSIHSKVEGRLVAEHPLVLRVLKGAYNSRPPFPRYNTFWDVGVVLQHIRGWGQNSSLLCTAPAVSKNRYAVGTK